MRSRAWYGFVLRQFPRGFRDRFANEVLDVIDAQRRALHEARPLAVASFHLATTFDLIRTLAHERLLGATPVVGALLLVGAGGHLVYDLANPALAMGVPAWVITLIAGTVGIQIRTQAALCDSTG